MGESFFVQHLQTQRAITSALPDARGLALSFTSPADPLPFIAINWPFPPSDFQLGPTDIHVWASRLDVPETPLERFASTLAPFEMERAQRFRFPRHRQRFIAGRGLLRSILAHYLQCDPADVEFSYGTNGKPLLTKQSSSSELFFNQTHSEDLTLITVTKTGPIGIDLEYIRPLPDAEELVARFFSQRESEQFRSLSEQERNGCFFNLWTRKEAWLKATGEGIGHCLGLVEVAFLPEEPVRLLSIAGDEKSASEWQLHKLSPACGYVAALATQARAATLSCWRWPELGLQ